MTTVNIFSTLDAAEEAVQAEYLHLLKKRIQEYADYGQYVYYDKETGLYKCIMYESDEDLLLDDYEIYTWINGVAYFDEGIDEYATIHEVTLPSGNTIWCYLYDSSGLKNYTRITLDADLSKQIKYT